MAAEGTAITTKIRRLLQSPSLSLKKSKPIPLTERVTLEKVLGLTVSSSSALACEPKSALVAYPAGCVVVLLNPKKRKQTHILNASRKTITAVAFSPCGKYLVTGESGHMPAVRVWDVAERNQVYEFQGHKYGVSCVVFSPNMKYIVSVGHHHDMIVNVWDWKRRVLAATNKVSSKVLAVSFSADSGTFVTVGNRHVKFWYIDASKTSKAASACCLSVSEELIFCGCADGTVRIYNPENLRLIVTIPKPHHLGLDVVEGIDPSHLPQKRSEERFPDTVALTFDPTNRWLSCVYSDHSLYVWDVRDVRKVGKVYSALYHSSCVWGVETYPAVEGPGKGCLPAGTFVTCSSDNTVRLWNPRLESNPSNTNIHRNIYSADLLKVIYMDGNLQFLQDVDPNPTGGTDKTDSETKSGIRTLRISPDGQHLAAGDRVGNVRIYDLALFVELVKIEAHDTEVMCLEYSKPETEMRLLATASRDRLIHVLNMEKGYSLEQTLDEHSSAVTAVRIAGVGDQAQLVSCGMDKSIYFRNVEKEGGGLQFARKHHVVSKSTLYDMDVDVSQKYAVIGCQDRNIRIFNLGSGKQRKCFKGSQGEDGSLIKVQIDPSGLFVATSCSDKNLCINDLYTGECMATMFGHSEIVTGMKFSNDCKSFISVSADSCVFIWRLNTELIATMRHRLAEMQRLPGAILESPQVRRITQNPAARHILSSDSDSKEDVEQGEPDEEMNGDSHLSPNCKALADSDLDDPFSVDHLPQWAKKQVLDDSSLHSQEGSPVIGSGGGSSAGQRRRWTQLPDASSLLVKSMLDLRQFEAERDHFSSESDLSSRASPVPNGVVLGELNDQDPFITSNVDSLLDEMEASHSLSRPNSLPLPLNSRQLLPTHLALSTSSPTPERAVNLEQSPIPANSEAREKPASVEPGVVGAPARLGFDVQSPDSACYARSGASPALTPKHLPIGTATDENSTEEEEEPTRSSHSDISPQTPDKERFLKQIFCESPEPQSHEPSCRTTGVLRGRSKPDHEGSNVSRCSISTKFRSSSKPSPSRAPPGSPGVPAGNKEEASPSHHMQSTKEKQLQKKASEVGTKAKLTEKKSIGPEKVSGKLTEGRPQPEGRAARGTVSTAEKRLSGIPRGPIRVGDRAAAMKKSTSMCDLAHSNDKLSLHASSHKRQARLVARRECHPVDSRHSSSPVPVPNRPEARSATKMRMESRKTMTAIATRHKGQPNGMSRSISIGDGLHLRPSVCTGEEDDNTSDELRPARKRSVSAVRMRPRVSGCELSPAPRVRPVSLIGMPSQPTVCTSYRTSLVLELSKSMTLQPVLVSSVTKVEESCVKKSRSQPCIENKLNKDAHANMADRGSGSAGKAKAVVEILQPQDSSSPDIARQGHAAKNDNTSAYHLRKKLILGKMTQAMKDMVVTEEHCRETMLELQQVLQKAILLYHKVTSSDEMGHEAVMGDILRESLQDAVEQLHSIDLPASRKYPAAPPPTPTFPPGMDGPNEKAVQPSGNAPSHEGEGQCSEIASPSEEKTNALLEHYSEMLMKLMEKKILENK
uniref:mitogen-activated protein kinase-binding protein 1-like isoform X3 n=1 Tax=Myxine glutinosa TaxID=7769 RepID=UPI00358FC1D3